MVAYAPDGFPAEDYLQPDEQLDLEKAFHELFRGMDLVDIASRDPICDRKLRAILQESLQAYRSGDDIKGAHLIQDFEVALVEAIPRKLGENA